MDTDTQAIVPVDLTGTVFQDVAEQNLVIPGSEPPKLSGWVVIHAGPGHPKTIALNDKNLREYNARELDKERARTNNKKWKGDDKDPVEQRREFVESIVARIVTWNPIALDGKVYEFSDKTAIDLLMQPRMGGYVAQMREFQAEEKSFMKGSATS